MRFGKSGRSRKRSSAQMPAFFPVLEYGLFRQARGAMFTKMLKTDQVEGTNVFHSLSQTDLAHRSIGFAVKKFIALEA